MSALSPLGVLVSEASLVLSSIVLIYWIAYSAMLYHQMKRGSVRKDWWLSMIFYAGIGMLVLANIFLVISELYKTSLGESLSRIFMMFSMLVFVYGFRLRMKNTLKVEDVLDGKLKKPKKKR